MDMQNLFTGDINDIENPLGGIISIRKTTLNKLEVVLSEYMQSYISNFTLDTKFEQELYEQIKQIGLPLFQLPKLVKTKIARVGHALSTFIVEKCYELDIPILPWAIPLARDQDLSNYDAIFFDKNDCLWILETKTSSSKKYLSSKISELISKLKSESLYSIYLRASRYHRHYSTLLDTGKFLQAFIDAYKKKRNSVRIIGFFIAPDVTQNIGSKFEEELKNPFEAIRRNVAYPNLVESSDRIYAEIDKNV